MLEGQRLLITGASRGIGAAAAAAALDHGAQVVGQYVTAEGALAGLRDRFGADRVHAVRADLAEPAAVDAVWQQAMAWTGGLTGLVNNAAVMPYSGPADPGWAEDWQHAWAVNVRAVADLCRHAVLAFPEAGGGRIVNIASRAAFRGDMPDAMHYAASKGAVVALTRSLAKGYARDKIGAFIVAPGWVKTERVLPRLADKPEAVAEIPIGDACPPEQVGALICFLLSGQVDHATGGTFDINGASYFH
ncbi:MAG: SDR family NAD(P)-dependent oxidoreductase [Rhodothalassiaceae bacterium]